MQAPCCASRGAPRWRTTAGGWCDAPHADPETCTWRATVDKVVNKSCSDNVVHGAVETYDASHAGCFSRCGAGSTGPQRNTTSPCWVYCLFATLIGPQAMLPGGGFDPATATDDTMPIGRLEDAFAKVFAPEHELRAVALSEALVVVRSAAGSPTAEQRAAVEAAAASSIGQHAMARGSFFSCFRDGVWKKLLGEAPAPDAPPHEHALASSLVGSVSSSQQKYSSICGRQQRHQQQRGRRTVVPRSFP